MVEKKPKILYFGTFGKHCSDPFRIKGFLNKNINFKVVDFRKIFKTGGHESLRNYVIHFLYSYNPDFVFVNKGEKFSTENLKLFRLFSEVPWVLFYGDQRNEIEHYLRDTMKFYDGVLVNADDEKYKSDLMKFGAKKVFYYHTATDLEIYKKDENAKEIFDIAFFGGNYEDRFPDSRFRKETIEFLRKKYNVGIFGMGWQNGFHLPVFGNNFAVMASKAKILLGINAFSNIRKYCSNRTWNSMACGFLISHHFKGIEEMFENHKHLVWFKTLPELVENIDYYLKNKDERMKIYKNGRDILEQQYTYDVRADETIDIYNTLKSM